jgi:3-oxoacyl-[acyl-carrier protein] reductase
MDKKVAVVTGAASGIGLAIAKRLARDGLHVVAVDRNAGVNDVAAALGRDGFAVEGAVVDLAHEHEILALVSGVAERHGRLDILVNNAGISPKIDGQRAVTETLSTARWLEVLEVNLTAPFLLCRECIPLMKARRWGRIVNMSSRAGRTYVKTAGAHYAATKAALIGFSRVVAGEHGEDGITVNCIAPGRITTPLSEQGSAEMLAALRREIPVGRAGEPDEIAAMTSFLVSDDAGFITGATFDVNGGAFMS